MEIHTVRSVENSLVKQSPVRQSGCTVQTKILLPQTVHIPTRIFRQAGGSTSYSMRNRGTKTSDKGTEAFITVIILALLAWYFFGNTGGLIVLVIGFLYLLRDLIKLIAVPAVAIAGFFVAESMGINGIIGLIATGIIAHFVINKLFRKK